MKVIFSLLLLILLFTGCQKKENKQEAVDPCDLPAVLAANEGKVTITSGIWGTVSSMEGNCMPPVATGSTCTHCAVKRTVRIYEYTLTSNAVPSTQPGFYQSFNTQLILETTTDDQGFFQAVIPPGNYTIVTIENGKLYASSTDGFGGLNPLTYSSGLLKTDRRLTYKAVF